MASSRLALTDGECNPSAPSKGQFHSPSIPRPVLTYDECNPSALLTVSYLTLPALRLALTYVESRSKCNASNGILLGKCDLVRYFFNLFYAGHFDARRLDAPGIWMRRAFWRQGFWLAPRNSSPPNDHFHVHPRPRTVGVIAFQKKLWLITKNCVFEKLQFFFKKTLFWKAKTRVNCITGIKSVFWKTPLSITKLKSVLWKTLFKTRERFLKI